MPVEIAELVAVLIMSFMFGTFLLLFPISRRLGKALEEWVRLRGESAPDRDLLARIAGELQEVRHQLDGVDRRVGLLAERQDFTESLIEQRRKAAIPPAGGVEGG